MTNQASSEQQGIIIELTEEQQSSLHELARRQGHSRLTDYVLALIEADARAHGVELELTPEPDIRAELKEALRQAIYGETVPLETLWTDDDEE
jgi:hypothetical protein